MIFTFMFINLNIIYLHKVFSNLLYKLNHRFIFILFIIINYRYINLKECKR